MNLRDLQYLVALADTCHFGKAAKRCFVSQPALSMQISKLEKYLGVSLIERNSKQVLLTSIGVALSKKARTILQSVQDFKETAALAKDPHAGELKVGIIPTLAPYLLPHIMANLSESFPKLSFYLVEAQTAVLIQNLQDGVLDTALLALPITGNFVATPLFQEAFILAVKHTHDLAKRRSLSVKEIEDKTLLLLEDGHCLREQALSFCQQQKAHEVDMFQATSLETLRHMVASGLGITLIPKLACHENDRIRYIPFTNPTPYRQIGMIWRPRTAKEGLFKKIAEKIKHLINEADVLN